MNPSCAHRTRVESGRRRRLSAAAAAAAVALVVGLPGPASAHAGLVSSDPEDGSRVRVNPGTVTLRFNETVPTDLARVVLVGADGTGRTEVLPIAAAGATGVRATLSGRETGTVRLSYRVTSADGHPIAGEVAFAVSEPAGGSTQDPGQDPEQDQTGSSDRSAGSSRSASTPLDGADAAPTGAPWLFVVGAVLLLALPLAVATLLRRAAGGRRR